MNSTSAYQLPYPVAPKYTTKVAYFSMEVAIDQCLKTYSGGLGFLAGSHMRSAYELKQALVGVTMLWSYGYYDQTRNSDGTMAVSHVRKNYSFLKETGIVVEVPIHGAKVKVKALYLPPTTFGSAPIIYLTTDIPENDSLSRSISHYLYDPNKLTRIAQSIVLGVGGAKVLEAIQWTPQKYHLNEAHGLPLAYYLLKHSDRKAVKKNLVFTTHTPEQAGNEVSEFSLLEKFNYFSGVPSAEVREISAVSHGILNHTLAGIKLAGKVNAVSKLHRIVSQEMWQHEAPEVEITSVTNAQNAAYWYDPILRQELYNENWSGWKQRKRELKQELFKEVADQTGKLFDPEVFTLVWARRFAGYKRPDLITNDFKRFKELLSQTDYPLQMIWAGKPYPYDQGGIDTFNNLVNLCKDFDNAAILTGYELALSRLVKAGSDGWLNTPRVPREASGTSGMTAAMNGSVNISTYDGWICEFAKDEVNSFIFGEAHPDETKRSDDCQALLDTLTQKVLPIFYDQDPSQWVSVAWNGACDVVEEFESSKLADAYYRKIYA